MRSFNEIMEEGRMPRREFLFNLDGLMRGSYVQIQTDSKDVIEELLKSMDDLETNE